MNTEINFLEKEPNKNSAFIALGTIFVLLLLLAVSALLFQKNNYDNQLSSLANERFQVESVLIEQQNTHGTERQLERLQEELLLLESEMLPAMELYHDIVGLLSRSEQLMTYDMGAENQIIMDAAFPSLNEVAVYMSLLTEQDYIQDIQLTSTVKMEDFYEATLTLTMAGGLVVEGFAAND
ncbi:hypothetical protein [Oceanobacillus rekensis]|uniref:hypothetical protein n=1 Tax=Oceanobacillus rekensis TaxID=937927 RepID=UPI000B437AFF|nr:hypothetical protein [Oceanobacillus rekensis]